MEAIKIQHLIGRCTDYFQANCYTGHRISRYISLWKHGIIPFMKAKGIDTYTPAIIMALSVPRNVKRYAVCKFWTT